jgi:hypothetical protein
MPRISPSEFYALPLRVHAFLADVPLHDVWAVDLPKHCGGVTLSEFTNSYLEFRIVPSMPRPSVPSPKGPIAIDSTLPYARACALRRSACA